MPKLPSSSPERSAYAVFLARLGLFCLRRYLIWVEATEGRSSPAARKLHRAVRSVDDATGALGVDEIPGEFWSPCWLDRYIFRTGNQAFTYLTLWRGKRRRPARADLESYNAETAQLQEALDTNGLGTLLLRGEEEF